MQNSNWRYRGNTSFSPPCSPHLAAPASVSHAPPTGRGEQNLSGAAAADSNIVQPSFKELMGSEQPLTSSERAFGLGEVQRKLRREVWESRGGWGGAEPESTVVGEGGGLRSPLNPVLSSSSFSPCSENTGTTPPSLSAPVNVQFGQISGSDPLFDMPDIGVWKASPSHPSPRQIQASTSSLSSLRLAHQALQSQLFETSNELLVLQADSQEQAWLSFRLLRAEERIAELQNENDGLRRELSRLGRHKEGVDELLGVRSPPQSPLIGRPVRSTGLVRAASSDSTELETDYRSTTPRPSTSTASLPPSSLPSSADPRSLILHDLLRELNSANLKIRNLQVELAQKEATVRELGGELIETREEKVKLLVQLFEGADVAL